MGGRREGCSESSADSERICCLLGCGRNFARKVEDFCLRISREWVEELLIESPRNESLSSYLMSTDGAIVADPALVRLKLDTSDVNDAPNLRDAACGCSPFGPGFGGGVGC